MIAPSFLVMDDLTGEHSFDLQATCVIDVLGLYFDMVSMGACKQELADAPSTGVGINCLYCTFQLIFKIINNDSRPDYMLLVILYRIFH